MTDRDTIARAVALAGLGTTNGEPRLPHGEWDADEFAARILEIIPERAAQKCFALADAILPTLPTSTISVDRELLNELLNYADLMPKKTPVAGSCSTEHPFTITAGAIWGLDDLVGRVRKSTGLLKSWETPKVTRIQTGAAGGEGTEQ